MCQAVTVVRVGIFGRRIKSVMATLTIRTTKRMGSPTSRTRASEFLDADDVETPDRLLEVGPGPAIDRLLRSSRLAYKRIN